LGLYVLVLLTNSRKKTFNIVSSPTQVNSVKKINSVNINKKKGTRQIITVILEKSKIF